MDTYRAVEVLANVGTEREMVWLLGSGFVVSCATVITAGHNLGGEDGSRRSYVWIRDLNGREWPVERIVARDMALDLAVLRVPGLGAGLEQVAFGRIDRRSFAVVEGVIAVGFPGFKEAPEEPKAQQRQSAQADGWIPTAESYSGGDLVFKIKAAPALVPARGRSPWEGFSGAGVVVADRLIGIVIEHRPAEGLGSLTIRALDVLTTQPVVVRESFMAALAINDDSLPIVDIAVTGQAANERHTHIEVSGGSSVVVGEYITLFQSFADQSRPISSFIRAKQFRTLVEERTKNFVGREFVFDRISRLTAGDEFPSGYVLIRGEPGIGKTAIAASLVLRGAYVHHFNIAPENIRSARQFLENVCAQLIVRHDLSHSAMPPEAGADAGFLSQLLVEAAERARQLGALPVVIVVDALDEAEDAGLPESANRLYLPRALPDGVFFVVTVREEADYRLDVDHLSEIWIRDNDPANEQDVMHYIDQFIEANADAMHRRIAEWQINRPEFVQELTKLSEGNFMYLVHVLPEIALARLSRDTVGGIQGLPHGLEGYYRRHWRDMKDQDPERFAQLQRPVLCFLAIGREPVTVRQLMEWTHLEPADVRGVISEWREFLNEDAEAEPRRYRIYHRSFAEFLDRQEDLRWYHDQISTTALLKIPGFVDGTLSS